MRYVECENCNDLLTGDEIRICDNCRQVEDEEEQDEEEE